MTYTDFVERYRDKSYIGSGGFSKVYKVFDFANSQFVALKIADVRPELNKFTLQNEVTLVNQLPLHPNIVRYDACYRFNTGITGEMDFAVLPFYENGNLEQFLLKKNLSANDRKNLIQQILLGVDFLHKNNCIHRDLKAQNILIHKEQGRWIPKISDFGLSRYVKGEDLAISNSSIGMSFLYAAPEQIKNKKIYKNVDLWAMGVMIYRIVTGNLPFASAKESGSNDPESQLEVSRKIINLELPAAIQTLKEPYGSMIRRCLVLDPQERAQSAEELLALLAGSELATPLAPPISESQSAPPIPPISRAVESDTKTEAILGKTEVIWPTPPPKEEPRNDFQYLPPANFQMPEYDNPRANVTQIVAKEPRQTSPPPKEPVIEVHGGEGYNSFNKLWIYLPLFLLLIGGTIWLLYRYLNPAPPPVKVELQEPLAPVEEITFTISPDFLACFENNRKAVGGTFALTPVKSLPAVFKGLESQCLDHTCIEFQAIGNRRKQASDYYTHASTCSNCCGPLLEATLNYHKAQLKTLPLLPLFFNSGAKDLSIVQKNRLDQYLKKHKSKSDDHRILIIGRASKVGKSAGNKALSKKRAERITDFMESHFSKKWNYEFVYFGADPPQLDIATADQYGFSPQEYKNISFGRGADKDFSLRLNQSVLLVIYSIKEDPFGLVD